MTISMPQNDGTQTVKKSAQELLNILPDIEALSGFIGNLTPFFDIQFLKNSKELDFSKIDTVYLTRLGQQMIQDHETLMRQAKNTISKIRPRCEEIINILNTSIQPVEVVANFHQECFTMSNDIYKWQDKYRRIVQDGTAGDVIRHIDQAKYPV